MQTAVFDVVHMFSELGISAVPIVDANGKVINLYETVDVIVSLWTTAINRPSKSDPSYPTPDVTQAGYLPGPGPNDSAGVGKTSNRLRRSPHMWT